jgi:hypothetical protein
MSRLRTDQIRLLQRQGGLLVAVLAALFAGALSRPAAAAPVPLKPFHEPPWLVAPGGPVTLA